MLVVSEKATERVAQMLDDVRAPEGVAARLVVVDEDELSMQPGRQEPGDTAYNHGERIVLVIGKDTLAAMDGMMLDVCDQDGDGLNLEVLPQPSDLFNSLA